MLYCVGCKRKIALAGRCEESREPLCLKCEVQMIDVSRHGIHRRLHVRWFIHRDVPEVLEIENHSFLKNWDEGRICSELRDRDKIGMVCELGCRGNGPVIGYMIYQLYKTKLHVIRFAVHQEWRRLGVGTKMASRLQEKLSSHRRTRISVDVSERSLESQLFWRFNGFAATRVDRGDDEDTYRMVYRLPKEAMMDVDR